MTIRGRAMPKQSEVRPPIALPAAAVVKMDDARAAAETMPAPWRRTVVVALHVTEAALVTWLAVARYRVELEAAGGRP